MGFSGTSTATKSRLKRWLFLAILLLATGSRFYFALRLENKIIWSDEQKNFRLAQNLASGAGYELSGGRPTAIIPPGYPLFLSGLHRIGLGEVHQIRLTQVLISILTILLCTYLARWLMGSAAAWGTLLLCGFYPYFIFLPGTILATTLYCMLLIAAVLIYLKALTANNNNMMFFGGVVWGVATLTVTTASVLAGATLLWHARHAPGSRKAKAISAFSLIAGLLVVVTPWLLRNQLVLGKMTLATNGGYNLWLGNHAASKIENPNSVPTPAELNDEIAAAPGNQELFADSLFTAKAGAFITRHPGLFVRRTLVKAAYFWRFDPSPVTASYVGLGGLVKLAGFLSFAPLLALAIYGYRKASMELRKVMALWTCYAVFYTLVHAVMIVKVRFRLPIDQFLVMAAAFGAVQLWQQVRRRRGTAASG